MKKRKFIKTEEDFIPLPDPYPLPKHYTYGTEVALRRGKMSAKEKSNFFDDVASSMLRYKKYPSNEDYLCVARSIVSKYRFLKAPGTKPYVSIVPIDRQNLIVSFYFPSCRMH